MEQLDLECTNMEDIKNGDHICALDFSSTCRNKCIHCDGRRKHCFAYAENRGMCTTCPQRVCCRSGFLQCLSEVAPNIFKWMKAEEDDYFLQDYRQDLEAHLVWDTRKISWEHLYCHAEIHSFVNWLEDNPSFAYNVTPRRLLSVYQHYAYSLDHQEQQNRPKRIDIKLMAEIEKRMPA